MTDGISDPKFDTDNGLANPALWDVLWDEINPLIETADPEKALVDWLDFFSLDTMMTAQSLFCLSSVNRPGNRGVEFRRNV